MVSTIVVPDEIVSFASTEVAPPSSIVIVPASSTVAVSSPAIGISSNGDRKPVEARAFLMLSSSGVILTALKRIIEVQLNKAKRKNKENLPLMII